MSATRPPLLPVRDDSSSICAGAECRSGGSSLSPSRRSATSSLAHAVCSLLYNEASAAGAAGDSWRPRATTPPQRQRQLERHQASPPPAPAPPVHICAGGGGGEEAAGDNNKVEEEEAPCSRPPCTLGRSRAIGCGVVATEVNACEPVLRWGAALSVARRKETARRQLQLRATRQLCRGQL